MQTVRFIPQRLPALLFLFAASLANADPAEVAAKVNLLQLPSASPLHTSLPGGDIAAWRAATDCDPATSASIETGGGSPIDLVYDFGGKTVTVQQLVVDCNLLGTDSDRPASVELLVSTLSPHTGFRSLRVCRPNDASQPQTFSFVASAAKWVMLRVTPRQGAKRVGLSEITVRGNVGTPKTNYAFQHSPARALSVIAELRKLVKITVTDDEARLFADVTDGTLDEFSFAEAALIASGATDAVDRAGYLKSIDQLTDEAAKRMLAEEPDFTRGEKLLGFLHDQAFVGGYDFSQTRLSTVIAEQTYNCVSSATLYNVIGRRLGLDVRAIEVPDHAFSILYDGAKHADVEATTPGGFNPARDPDALKQFAETTGMNYIADLHPEKRREIDQAGLVALIYYNRGVSHSERGEHAEALVRYFCALSLDPEFTSAVKNSLATLANWSVSLADAEEFEAATAVVRAGLKLAPKDAALRNNRTAIWGQRIAVAVDAGECERALRLVRTAVREVPGDEFRAMESWVFLRPAETLVQKGQWGQAINVARRGLSEVDRLGQTELTEWCKGAFVRWSNRYLDERDYARALDPLERGLSQYPEDPRLRNNVCFVAQEWCRELRAQEAHTLAESVLGRLMDHHANPGLKAVAHAHVVRVVDSMIEAGRFSDAKQVVSRCARFIDAPDVRASIVRSLTDEWAKALADRQDWSGAVGVYSDQLRGNAGDAHLLHNRSVMVNRWVDSLIQTRQWSRATEVTRSELTNEFEQTIEPLVAKLIHESTLAICEDAGNESAAEQLVTLLKMFPGMELANDTAAHHFQRIAVEQAKAGRFESALTTIRLGTSVLPETESMDAVAKAVYGLWASDLIKHEKYADAVAVCSRAVKNFPDDPRLAQNAVATWDTWASVHIDAKRWKEAIAVYQRAIKSMPDADMLQNNLAYCQQAVKR